MTFVKLIFSLGIPELNMKQLTREHLLGFLEMEEILLALQDYLMQMDQLKYMEMIRKLNRRGCRKWELSISLMEKMFLHISLWLRKTFNLTIPKKLSKIYNYKKITVKSSENRIFNLVLTYNLIKMVRRLQIKLRLLMWNKNYKVIQSH